MVASVHAVREVRGASRFRSKWFWGVIAFFVFDFVLPFAPLGALLFVVALGSMKVNWWIARQLLRYHDHVHGTEYAHRLPSLAMARGDEST